MLAKGAVNSAFRLYWDEMDRCRDGKAYYALLHLTVCLPDICAALQSSNGETSGNKYKTWCDQYLTNPKLTGAERWDMRCKVLHQGRASIPPGRYDGFSFAQPAANGEVDHERLDGTTFILDVGKMAEEMKAAVEAWITKLESNLSANDAVNAAKNLPSLIQVRKFTLPGKPGLSPPVIINRSS